MAIKVLAVDDHVIVLRGLQAVFSQEDGDIQLVATAHDVDQVLPQIELTSPDVVLLDVRLPSGDGLSLLEGIQSNWPDLPVVMFSGYDNPTYEARAIALGAAGFLSKSVSCDRLVAVIRLVASGQTAWSAEELRGATGRRFASQAGADLDARLTRRESEVLRQLSYGLTNKEIARMLGISCETVKEHVQHILRKVGVSDRTQAAVWAVRNHLI